MTFAPRWLLRLAGFGARRERALAEESRTADRRALAHEVTVDERGFRERMDEVASPSVTLGVTSSSVSYRIGLDDLVTLPWWVTAGTGAGKSRFVGSVMNQVLTAIVRGEPVSLVVVDGKGETVDQLLRSVADLLSRLPDRQAEALLRALNNLSFFDRRYLPSWPLLARVPGVDLATQADAIAEILTEVSVDATVGPRQRSTLAAVLALAVEFEVPIAALPWLLAAPDDVAALAARSSLPAVRLDLSRFGREPQGSIDGLVARLGTLVRVPSVKAILSSERPFNFSDSLQPGKVTTLSFGGADLGARGTVRALGSLAITALANAAFDPRRNVGGKTLIVLDEPQVLFTSVCLGQLERLLTLARSYGAAGLVFIHQGATQIPQDFQAILNTNVVLRVLGRSSEHDASAASEWLPTTGRVPRRREPGRAGNDGRFLSEGEERRFRVAEIGRLPARHFLVADRRTRAAFNPRVVVAPAFDPPPWSAIEPGVADAVRRGALGVPRAELEARVKEIEEAAAARFEQTEGARPGRARRNPVSTPDVVGAGERPAGRGRVP